ncbi:MAG: hypothetical protein M3N47_02240 [Chloroflexota bacterium]|nr:hypothetical protein [Chloroflexota bacterium]
MRRTLATLLLAICAVGLWVLVEIEREQTDMRAPWTGITTVAAALAFVGVGVFGRVWRALIAATGAAIAGVYLSPLIVYGHGRWSYEEPDVPSSCDPGCIPFEALAVAAAVAALLLAATGIAARRVAVRVTRR